MSAQPEHHPLRSLRSPTEALLRIESMGYVIHTTPITCQGSAEQGGRNAHAAGFESTQAVWLEDNFEKTGDDGDTLAEWLHGYWQAHQSQSTEDPNQTED